MQSRDEDEVEFNPLPPIEVPEKPVIKQPHK
jgi:hypothetical protein